MKFSFDELNLSTKRIALAKTALKKSGVDAMIFFDGDRYGGKFANTIAFTALVLFPDREPLIIAHSIEKDHAESESKLQIAEIKDTKKLSDTFRRLFPERTKHGKPKAAVVPWNATFERCKMLQELGFEIIDVSDSILPECLQKPFPEEIEAIRKLTSMCDKGMEAADDIIQAGLKEYEVAAEIDYAIKNLGATEFSFPTLVASGYRGAFPHGWTSSKKINEGDGVVVDIGPILNDYDGCVCRTFTTAGRQTWKREIEVVQAAIYNSLEIIKSQKTTSAAHVDKIARETVKKHGYRTWPSMKTVWTGHPIGGFSSPVIAPYSEDEIEEGMVFTVEPGIYIKGKGGVRIEHHVLAKRYNYEILDKFPEVPV